MRCGPNDEGGSTISSGAAAAEYSGAPSSRFRRSWNLRSAMSWKNGARTIQNGRSLAIPRGIDDAARQADQALEALRGKGGAMEPVRALTSLALPLWVSADHAYTQGASHAGRPPIIDMHIHAFSWDHQGDPPPPSPVTGRCQQPAPTRKRWRRRWLSWRRYNVVRGCGRRAVRARVALVCRRPEANHQGHHDASAGCQRPA